MTTITNFINRHIPFEPKQQQKALQSCKMATLNDLINKTIPQSIQKTTPLSINGFSSESNFWQHIQDLSNQNTIGQCHIGGGYYNTLTPAPILRNIFENPGWYTQYTPYQAEISQGRLEALLNFQTMICECTQLDIANASLLDEATAAAEAMTMLFRSKPQSKQQAQTLLVTNDIFPQTLQVVKTRAYHLNITVTIINPQLSSLEKLDNVFGLLCQTPNRHGEHSHLTPLLTIAENNQIPVICCSDLMYLCLFEPPKQIDVCVGSTQRFGVPLGYGGPHAAFFATKKEYSRKIPGRIIGATTDKHNNIAYRMALQTREQHIRKEKATSNICTAQALLAIMASMYAVYHGPKGLQHIALQIHELTRLFYKECQSIGIHCLTNQFFDTISIPLTEHLDINKLNQLCENESIFLNTTSPSIISINFDETHNINHVQKLINILKSCYSVQKNKHIKPLAKINKRSLTFMQQAIFNTHHSETQLMRYMKHLENKDLSLTSSMIPLGSCTMKLNAAIEMMPLSLAKFSQIHPFRPLTTQKGYQKVINTLGQWLCDITDLDDISFQPNSGAQGEYAGILAIKNYHIQQNQAQRHIALIPTSAHGTNPASAALAGLTIVPVKCNNQGDIDLDDLTTKCIKYKNELSLLMVTYPSTHGVFDDTIELICNLIHDHGGQVYMDGANLNAQVGLTSPGIIGADVCHINLHKTFAIPHGGGGPGMGPICVKKHLTPFLPDYSLDTTKFTQSVAAAPYSSASILLISYAYIGLMGATGLTEASKQAILKANYIKARLEPYYPILFTGKNNTVAHELIIDCQQFKKSANITVEDIAKRLIDYSFHAPTLSWPIAGTLMIEPTESEPIAECDRFCDAMISIYNEIQDIINGKVDKVDNVLKQAPHTQQEACSDTWTHPYSRQQAIYPVPELKEQKWWPTIGRVNQSKGDRDLICTCDSSILEKLLIESS